MAATSRKPHVAGPITEMAPQPRLAPTRPSEAESRVTLAATWPGIHAPAVPADQDGLGFAARPGGAQHRGQGDAEGDLVDARAGHVAGEGDQRRAGIVDGAQAAIPGGAEAGDDGQVGEGLHVVDQRRAAPHAALVGAGRYEGRFGLAAVEPVHQGGLLAGDVAAGGGLDPYRDPVGVRLITFGQRCGHRLDGGGGGPIDADDGLAGADASPRPG